MNMWPWAAHLSSPGLGFLSTQQVSVKGWYWNSFLGLLPVLKL